MSEEKKLTPGQAAFAEYYGRQAGAALVMPESWAMQSEAGRADWEAAASAAIAQVVNPTAEDFDHAAEIVKLRATVTELLDAFDFNQHGWNVARITDEHLARLRARL